MLNHITIMGRFTKDPELRRTQSGTGVASFTIACERDYTGKASGVKETDFIECVAWHKTADFVEEYFRKGMMAVVSGRLEIRSWQDKDGNKRKTAEIRVEDIYFAEKKNGSDFKEIEETDENLPF